MTKIIQYQWHIFTIVSGVIFIFLVYVLLPIHSLYTSYSVRKEAENILIESSERYGLPKSDFFFVIAEESFFRLCIRKHGRNNENVVCDDFAVRDFPDI